MNNKFTFFWHGPFSQWHKSDFIIYNIKYSCMEQYMMATKARIFNDKDTYDKIMNSTSPKEIKALGREVKNFDEKIWKKYRFEVVYRGNLAKFLQNSELEKLLLDTGDTLLVEASPYDKIWGIGLSEESIEIYDMNNWPGLNLLGRALTSVRDYIKTIRQLNFIDNKLFDYNMFEHNMGCGAINEL